LKIKHHSQADGLKARFKGPEWESVLSYGEATKPPCTAQASFVWQYHRG